MLTTWLKSDIMKNKKWPLQRTGHIIIHNLFLE